MSTVPLVIIIPTRNRRPLLERALESVRTQAYDHYRVVVINDASIDDTRTYLDSFDDPRFRIVHQAKNRGVNVARNMALSTLREGEWAVLLDDDDFFLPGALAIVARGVTEVPPDVQILCFNTVMRNGDEEFPGGYHFLEGERYYEPTYDTLMTGNGLRMYPGTETRVVLKWTLFPKYLFAPDVNGFEGEMWILMGRDGVRTWFLPGQIIVIDWAHEAEHLRDVAVRRDPAAFVRAYRRILPAHARFYDKHQRLGRAAALSGMKLAVHAMDPLGFFYFASWYVRWVFLGVFQDMFSGLRA